MSAGVNRVTLLGNLGADPELRSTPGGQRVTEFRLATTHRWKDREGERREETQWHRVETWGRTAELCGQYLSRGSQAFVEGRLKTDHWQDREGRDRYTTKVVATRVLFLSKGRAGSAGDLRQERSDGERGATPGAELREPIFERSAERGIEAGGGELTEPGLGRRFA